MRQEADSPRVSREALLRGVGVALGLGSVAVVKKAAAEFGRPHLMPTAQTAEKALEVYKASGGTRRGLFSALEKFAVDGLEKQCFLPLAMKERPPPSTSPFKGIGMGWSHGTQEKLRELGVQMTYNWATNWQFYELYAEQGIEYIPLIDGVGNPPDEEVIDFYERNPRARLFLLCEPEWQSVVSPQEALGLLDHYVNLIGEKRIIFGNVVALDSQGWLAEFVGLYKATHQGRKPPVLGYGGHAFYDDAVLLGKCPENWDANAYRRWLQSFVDKVAGWDPEAEVWFTEWGILRPTPGFPIEELMRTGVAWFEAKKHPHFWFASKADGPQCPDCCCSTLDDNLNLTELGEVLRELP